MAAVQCWVYLLIHSSQGEGQSFIARATCMQTSGVLLMDLKRIMWLSGKGRHQYIIMVINLRMEIILYIHYHWKVKTCIGMHLAKLCYHEVHAGSIINNI